MLRKATEEDFLDLIVMRCEAYGCSRTQSAGWLHGIVGLDNLLVLEKPTDGPGPSRFAAMLAAVPVKTGYRKGIWFAGMATRADLRGRGLMTKLVETCLRAYAESGYHFAVTVPGSGQAAEYFARMQFQNAFPMRAVTKPIPRNLLAQADFDTMPVRRLCETRLRYQPGCVMLPESTMTEMMTELYSAGITVVSNPRGYGLYYTDGDLLQFIELQADNDHSADILLQAAREKTGATTAKVLLSENQSLYLGEGRRCPYGMIRFFKKPFPLTDVYFRLLI